MADARKSVERQLHYKVELFVARFALEDEKGAVFFHDERTTVSARVQCTAYSYGAKKPYKVPVCLFPDHHFNAVVYATTPPNPTSDQVREAAHEALEKLLARLELPQATTKTAKELFHG